MASSKNPNTYPAWMHELLNTTTDDENPTLISFSNIPIKKARTIRANIYAFLLALRKYPGVPPQHINRAMQLTTELIDHGNDLATLNIVDRRFTVDADIADAIADFRQRFNIQPTTHANEIFSSLASDSNIPPEQSLAIPHSLPPIDVIRATPEQHAAYEQQIKSEPRRITIEEAKQFDFDHLLLQQPGNAYPRWFPSLFETDKGLDKGSFMTLFNSRQIKLQDIADWWEEYRHRPIASGSSPEGCSIVESLNSSPEGCAQGQASTQSLSNEDKS